MCKVFYSLKYLRTWELRLSPLIGSFYHFSPLLTWLFLNLLYIQVCLFLSALHTNTTGTFLSDLSRCHSADKYLSLASDHLQRVQNLSMVGETFLSLGNKELSHDSQITPCMHPRPLPVYEAGLDRNSKGLRPVLEKMLNMKCSKLWIFKDLFISYFDISYLPFTDKILKLLAVLLLHVHCLPLH